MDKDEALHFALKALESVSIEFVCNGAHHAKKDRHEWLDPCPIVDRYKEAITAIKAALEAKDEPVGSFMTRLQAIDFLLKMRPQTEPTEKQIIATIDAYSALFGDMIESPTPTQRKPLTDEEIERIYNRYGGEMINCARAIERAHGIKGEA